jgi:hypothetical protein
MRIPTTLAATLAAAALVTAAGTTTASAATPARAEGSTCETGAPSSILNLPISLLSTLMIDCDSAQAED